MATMKERTARKRERQERLVEAIKENPGVKYSEIARRLGVPLHIVRNDFSELMRNGKIERRRNERSRIEIDERRRAVLDLLLDDPTLTCPEIARKLKITIQVAQNDRFLLQAAGLIKSKRRSRAMSKELMKQAANLDDFDDSVHSIARKLGVPHGRLIKAREILRCRFLVDRGKEEAYERDFRERQKANRLATSKLRYKGYACFGFMGSIFHKRNTNGGLLCIIFEKRGSSGPPMASLRFTESSGEKSRRLRASGKLARKCARAASKQSFNRKGTNTTKDDLRLKKRAFRARTSETAPRSMLKIEAADFNVTSVRARSSCF